VKTLDCFRLDDGGAMRHHLLGVVVVELGLRSVMARHRWRASLDPISKTFGAGVGRSRSSIFYTWLSCHHSRFSRSAGWIGAPWPGARGQAVLFGDSLVGVVQQCPVVSQEGAVSPLISSRGASCGV
jgi:hypothetical protein